jgi:hypothetical protein
MMQDRHAQAQVKFDYGKLTILRDNAYTRMQDLVNEQNSGEYLQAMHAVALAELALQTYTQNTVLSRLVRILDRLEQR